MLTGFARAEIKELSAIMVTDATGKVKQERLNTVTRSTRFQQIFPVFGINSEYFTVKPGQTMSHFDKHCKVVFYCFKRRWNPNIVHQYRTTFSTDKWVALSTKTQKKHSLTQCRECAHSYASYQKAFPGATWCKKRKLPALAKHMCDEYLIQAMGENEQMDVVEASRDLAEGIEKSYKEKVGRPFLDIVTSTYGKRCTGKQNAAEKKKEQRQLIKKCVNHMQQLSQANVAQMVLQEGLSLRSYNRMCLLQSFEAPGKRSSGKVKTHSPSLSSITWDTSGAMMEIENWVTTTKLNGSALARKYNVPGCNGGQVLKEYAQRHGVNTYQLDGLEQQKRDRRRKLIMPGGEISVPCAGTVEEVKEVWKRQINEGVFTVGEECAPREVTTLSTQGGEVVTQARTIHSRKVPLKCIQERLLKLHEPYMRLQSDDQLDSMSRADAIEILKRFHEAVDDSENIMHIRHRIKDLQRRRHLVMWHDHGTILGQGYIFITVKVLYDPAIFLTKEEMDPHNPNLNIQGIIEKPEVHIIGFSSAAHEQQTILIQDRVSCLKDSHVPIMSSNGIPVEDTILYFTGDGPARNYERGVQQGGAIRCGACGIQATMTSDIAHSLTLMWRTLEEQQNIILAGQFGKKAELKPLSGLSKTQLQLELTLRGIDVPSTALKKELEANLQGLLRGFVRVPTLLMNNPCQSLQSLHLERYTILECEPMHDLKGHIHNLLTEVTSYLDPSIKPQCEAIIAQVMTKETKRACDYRHTAILLLMNLLKYDGQSPLCLIFRTIVEMSEIMYSSEDKRTTRSILRFYNLTWLHAMTCTEVMYTPRNMTPEKFFGAYFHALSSHAAQQYEVVCLKSVNTENEERILGMASKIATTTSNRKPENVLPNILLRLQAGAQRDRNTLEEQNNSIRAAAKQLPPATNTTVTKVMMRKYAFSWQAHLNIIAPYLEAGQGVWWDDRGDHCEFFDGPHEPAFRPEGPPLKHFRNTSLELLDIKKREIFKALIEVSKLPAETLRVYDTGGYCTKIIDSLIPCTSAMNEPVHPQTSIESSLASVLHSASVPHVESSSAAVLHIQSSSDSVSHVQLSSASVPCVQSSSVPRVQSSSVPRVQSSSVPRVQSSSVSPVQSSSVPRVQSSSVPHVQSSSVPRVQSSSVPRVQSSSVSPVQSSSVSPVQSSSVPPVQSSSVSPVQSSSVPRVQSSSVPRVQSSSVSPVQSSSVPHMQSSSTSVYPQPSNTEMDSSITKEHFKTKTAEQICRFLGVTCRNEIVQLDGLRHKIKMMKRAKNDLTRTSMGRQHDRTCNF